MNAFEKLLTALAVPLGWINGFGGIVAGIWLAILGDWGSIGVGVGMLIFGGFGLGIAMMPGMLFAAPAAVFHEKGNKVGSYAFTFLSVLYTVVVLTIWCLAILYFFAVQADSSSIIPVLLWSYGVATGPIAFLAQKDLQSGNEYAMILTFFAQVAYLLAILVVLFARVSVIDVLVLFGIVMLVGLVIQLRIAYQEERARAFIE